MDNSHFFECVCHSDEHILRFMYDKDDNQFYTTIFLNQYRNIFKRIWIAIKYIFGYKCKYGHWDQWILKYEEVDRMKKLLDKIHE